MTTIRRLRILALPAVLLLVFAAVAGGCASGKKEAAFTFVHVSDIHVPSYGSAIGMPLDEAHLMTMHNQMRLKAFAEECLAMDPRPAFVANSGDTGDVGWTPFLKLYCKLMQPLVDAGLPIYTAVGNHDLDYTGIGCDELAEFFDPLGPAKIGKGGVRYSFDHEGCHIVFMNNRPISGLIRFNPEDLAWLANDLSGIDHETRVLLILHANMMPDDTYRVAEILQPFRRAAVFQGHRHTAGFDTWGGIPVVMTSSLYAGKPEAGSYSLVTVHPDSIVVRTRDYASDSPVPGTVETLVFPTSRPTISVTAPAPESTAGETVEVKAAVSPAATGTMEYSVNGISDWQPMTGGEGGSWNAEASVPSEPGRHIIYLRFTGENGVVAVGHTVVRKDPEQARVAWSHDLGAAMQGAPVAWNDLVIVPTIEKGIHAFRIADGGKAWSLPVNQGQIVGRIVEEDGTVFACAGRTVFSCDAATGAKGWETKLAGSCITGLTVRDGRLFAPSGEYDLYCLDVRDGSVIWRHKMELPIIMEVSVDDDAVYAGSMDGCTLALDAATGAVRWKRLLSDLADSYTTAAFWTPMPTGDRIISAKRPTENDDNNIFALSRKDGSVLWSARVSAWPQHFVPSSDGRTMYTTFARGRERGIQSVSVRDGSVAWSAVTGVGMYAGKLAGTDIVMRDDHRICCADARTGAPKWTYRLSTGPQGSLYGPAAFAVSGTTVVAGTMDGHLIALTWQAM